MWLQRVRYDWETFTFSTIIIITRSPKDGHLPYFLKINYTEENCAYNRTSQVALVVKNPPANAGNTRDAGLIPGLGKIPWRRTWQPTPVFFPGRSHEQRSLADYSPWGRKESDPTENLLKTWHSLVSVSKFIQSWKHHHNHIIKHVRDTRKFPCSHLKSISPSPSPRQPLICFPLTWDVIINNCFLF